MSLVTLSNIGQSFGSFDLFGGVSASVPGDGKIGLVGPNGVGKTTLLLIMTGQIRPSAGTVHIARGNRLGYLPQESAQAFAGREHTVYQEMLMVFDDLRGDEDRLREMEGEMAAGKATEEFLERYGAAQLAFELAGGYEYELRIQQVLDGLGFGRDDWGLILPHLSGGQKTRLLLARLLLEEPDLLVLDEPTNHLDVRATEWLEGTLRNWPGAVLVVSHDRYFLDRVITSVWEMSRAGIELYRGNYSAFVEQREARWVEREKAFAAQKERLEKELDYIRRNIAGQRSQMAKGKLSRISRRLEALQRAGLDGLEGKTWAEISDQMGGGSRRSMSVAEAAAAIKDLTRPDGRRPSFQSDLASGRRSGELVLRTRALTVGYTDKPLFEAEDIELHRLECAALIGPNGAGKTTFLRTILGQVPPLSGQVKLGSSLEIGYFEQAHEGLMLENRVIDELLGAQEMPMGQARNYLARYLFRGDDVYRLVGELSGGERGRLALAILALQGANFLLLDEPTNHLDIPAQEMLQDVLESFQGTILMVSHDRYLVDRLASQIWLLEEGILRIFEGTYQEYLAQRQVEMEAAREAAARERDSSRRARRQERQKSKNERLRVERLAELEREIAALEKKLEELGRYLQEASQAQVFDKIQSLSIEYATLERELEARLGEWEKLAREQTLA